MKFSILTVFILLFSCTEAKRNSNSRDNGGGDREPNRPEATPVEIQGVLDSHISRTRSSDQKSYNDIRNMISSGDLNEKDYRIIPTPELDNTGELIEASKPLESCGIDLNLVSIKARMNSCATQNKDRHFWDQERFGIAGESRWSLVANNVEENFSIWIDERTGLVWSHKIARTKWNKASGHGVLASEFTCGNLDVIPKDQISWRLPTRNEFLQADIDGHRAVNYDLVEGDLFWTATSDQNLDRAWAINIKTGVLTDMPKDSLVEVKCVGEVIK